ncbi:tumor necrosis factor ligand superfamily member 14-like [Solea senegalensis]|uniref:Tumor necrosis factor ligand superfamily member 14-like n=2 Tax=Solea senegalensis TaxID=28829 RepID=A0AAV6RKL0_SOLSE|nr:tumor necrosis factor ligand superfamily member 14-like [Solea senegalensis]
MTIDHRVTFMFAVAEYRQTLCQEARLTTSGEHIHLEFFSLIVMEKDGYPSVFVVDRPATGLPLPPRLRKRQQCGGACQTVLIMLVSVALCGMAIEACFIYHLYHLYHPESVASASSSKLVEDEDVTHPTEWPNYNIPPSKPLAQLTDGQDVVYGPHIMKWSTIANPFLYEMDYNNGGLIVKKEGYYYVYSKVFFSDCGSFHHSVELHTQKYSEKPIPLLQSRKISPISSSARSNSYLGGVFHFDRDDALYVRVSNTTKIQRHKSYENIFGAFMI